jgi:uncharacterized Zn finger protein
MNIVVTKNEKVVKEVYTAFVESESYDGVYYKVEAINGSWTCTCPDHRHRGHNCKHIVNAKEMKKYDEAD